MHLGAWILLTWEHEAVTYSINGFATTTETY